MIAKKYLMENETLSTVLPLENYVRKSSYLWRIEKLYAVKSWRGVNVLDVGTGVGLLDMILDKGGARITGMDISPSSLKGGRELKRRYQPTMLNFVLSDAHNLPFKNNVFDSVICSSTLEYLKEPSNVLTQINRVLKAQGTLILIIPNKWSMFFLSTKLKSVKIVRRLLRLTPKNRPEYYLEIQPTHFFNPRDLKKMLNNSNFQVDKLKAISFGVSILVNFYKTTTHRNSTMKTLLEVEERLKPFRQFDEFLAKLFPRVSSELLYICRKISENRFPLHTNCGQPKLSSQKCMETWNQ